MDLAAFYLLAFMGILTILSFSYYPGGNLPRTIFAFLAFCVISISANAQLPGDFNCSGNVNGVDVTAYWYQVQTHLFNPIDTATCFWRNGDVNSDGLFSTTADCLQLIWMFSGWWQEINPPQPAYLDSIIIGTMNVMPGDLVSLPILINLVEDMGSIEFHIHYSNRYLSQPLFNANPPFSSNNSLYTRDTTAYIFHDIPHGMAPGRYLVGTLSFIVANDAPLDTSLSISLVSGWYFPSGFVNISYPTYFISPIMIDGAVHIGTNAINEPDLPSVLSLRCYPNPFNAQVTFSFSTSIESPIQLTIFDITGREITRFTDSNMLAGEHSYVWNASGMSSGIYFCCLRSETNIISRKIALIK
jgi:hypothetical protein